jgi:hypothetical protein
MEEIDSAAVLLLERYHLDVYGEIATRVIEY